MGVAGLEAAGDREILAGGALGGRAVEPEVCRGWWGIGFHSIGDRMKTVLFEDRLRLCLRTWSGA